jgi:hypothetical protein
VDFRACTESGNETVDFFSKCAVGEVGLEEVVEVFDARVREGCECVAVWVAWDCCVW